MAHIPTGGRAYIINQDEFAYKTRTMLGLENSAVCTKDDDTRTGFVGTKASVILVNTATSETGTAESVILPTDFRRTGIEVLDNFGISRVIQTTMLQNFMRNYTKEERNTYVAEYDALNKSDPVAVSAFVNAMLTMLS